MAEGEIAVIQLQPKRHQGLMPSSEAESVKEGFYPESQREHGPPDTLISEFQRPALLENKSLLFEATQLWYFVTTVLRN